MFAGGARAYTEHEGPILAEKENILDLWWSQLVVCLHKTEQSADGGREHLAQRRSAEIGVVSVFNTPFEGLYSR